MLAYLSSQRFWVLEFFMIVVNLCFGKISDFKNRNMLLIRKECYMQLMPKVLFRQERGQNIMLPCRSLGQSARLNQLYPDWLELHIGVGTVLGNMPVARPGQRAFVYNKFSIRCRSNSRYLRLIFLPSKSNGITYKRSKAPRSLKFKINPASQEWLTSISSFNYSNQIQSSAVQGLLNHLNFLQKRSETCGNP